MLEIIKRTEGSPSGKEQIDGSKVQIGYNSWGHISIRVVQTAECMPADGPYPREKDTLIVLNAQTSRELISFIKDKVNY